MANFRVFLKKDIEGGYIVTVPTLPECITEGDTIEEALTMAREVIELCIEERKEENEPILTDDDVLECILNIDI